MVIRLRLWVLLLSSLVPSLLAETAPPNVVLIMADDLGYHDLGCYGHPKIKTPVLDKLAQDGVMLTSFYAGATVCTPSRMALLTGSYPTRLGWTKGVVGHLMKPGKGLPPSAVTMAEVFQKAAYATGMVGKWHLGDEARFLPEQQGFDESYYIKRSNNQTSKLWRGEALLEDPFENRQLTKQFTEESIRFIEKHEAAPFLLYLSYTAPHFPLEALPDWKGKSSYGVFGDVVEEMDHRIGEILNKLDERKLTKKTIVVFLSDNGPEPMTKASLATPYRGKKWSALEGGTRVPCLLRFPGVLPEGVKNDALVSAMDLLPTLASACGIEFEKTPLLDGVNVWDSLRSPGKAVHPRQDLLYWHGSEGFQAIRTGSWKLFLSEPPRLYDLARDVEESKDVSDQHPDRVAGMRALAERRLQHLEEHTLGGTGG